MLSRSFVKCRTLCRLLSTKSDRPPKTPSDSHSKSSTSTSDTNSDVMSRKTSSPGYFVVTHGFTPGIYSEYNQVIDQIRGFSRGRFKKFSTYDEAYFYYFHSRHAEVEEVEEKSQIFEKVFNQAVIQDMNERNEDKSDIIRDNDIVSQFCNVRRETREPKKEEAVKRGVEEGEDEVRKSARIQSHGHTLSFKEETDEEFDLEQFENELLRSIEIESEKLHKPKRKTSKNRNKVGRPRKDIELPETGLMYTKEGVPIIYTDGCCLDQKLPESERRAGCGVFWGKNDSRNITERLWGTQTNQRAELWAAVRGVQSALQSGYDAVEIKTDSQYVVQGMTNWILKWRKNNFTAAQSKKPVKNRDLFALLDSLCCYIDVRWVKIKGHSSIKGNDMADALAKCGAQRSPRTIPLLNPANSTNDDIIGDGSIEYD